jgi:hypothetical protein
VSDHQRGQLLRAALGFAGLPGPSYDRALWALRTWLDSWAGIGHVAIGMAHQGFDLQLTRYDERGWRATFYTTGECTPGSIQQIQPSNQQRLISFTQQSQLRAIGDVIHMKNRN